MNVAGQLCAVLEVAETGFEEGAEEEPLALLDQAFQTSCAETPVAATARAVEVVNFILVVLSQVVEGMTGFWLSPKTEREARLYVPRR